MIAANGSGQRRRLNFELNLVPFVDVLSVCICFLLMTAVFIQLGTVNVNQAMGDAPSLMKQESAPRLNVRMTDEGDVILNFENVKGRSNKDIVFTGHNKKIDWSRTFKFITSERQRFRSLNTAMILPSHRSKYNDVVRMMDELRKLDVEDIGIAPL